jgi:hypothetical protein
MLICLPDGDTARALPQTSCQFTFLPARPGSFVRIFFWEDLIIFYFVYHSLFVSTNSLLIPESNNEFIAPIELDPDKNARHSHRMSQRLHNQNAEIIR